MMYMTRTTHTVTAMPAQCEEYRGKGRRLPHPGLRGLAKGRLSSTWHRSTDSTASGKAVLTDDRLLHRIGGIQYAAICAVGKLQAPWDLHSLEGRFCGTRNSRTQLSSSEWRSLRRFPVGPLSKSLCFYSPQASWSYA
eukprot:scaffold7913_cov101-Isochrysis_galbana.AAC.2